MKAHRASWMAFRGDIPCGFHVLHACDIPECVNPDHLFLGTPLDNARDKERKGRGNHASGLRNGQHTKPHRTSRGDYHYTRKTPGLKRGERNGRAVLAQSDVFAIRASDKSSRILGAIYGVTKTTILKIKRGHLWPHL
jgi:hypothetical protein